MERLQQRETWAWLVGTVFSAMVMFGWIGADEAKELTAMSNETLGMIMMAANNTAIIIGRSIAKLKG